VKVRVLQIDEKLKRISLSMKANKWSIVNYESK
jgi:ribosomal protein S1